MAPRPNVAHQAVPACMDLQACPIRPTKLFIGGLSRHTTTKVLREHFSRGGSVRVLDCVAMRQADGRPRGFGYVTLDSPGEAERILREPQVIDNRVVDVKPAVPDLVTGAGLTTPPAARREIQAASAAGPGAGLPLQHRSVFGWPEAAPDMFYNNTCPSSPELTDELPMDPTWGWNESMNALPMRTIHEPLDCLDLLRGRQPKAPTDSEVYLDCLDLLTQPGHQAGPGASASLSAAAPEFVPMLKQVPTPQGQLAKPAKVPFGERTNIAEEESREEIVKSLKAWDASNLYGAAEPLQLPEHFSERGSSTDDEDRAANSSTLPSELHSAASTPVMTAELPKDDGDASRAICVDVQKDDLHSEASSPVLTAEIPKEDVEASPAARATDKKDDLSDLPSVGSAFHATGDCRRCNFYPKGRCQNGKDCTFCHFPHEKQKLSRQEKRDRRAAAQLAQAENSSTGSAGDDPQEINSALFSRRASSGSDAVPLLPARHRGAFPILSSMSALDPGMYSEPLFLQPPLELPARCLSVPPGLVPPATRAAPGLEASALLIPTPLRVPSVPTPCRAGHHVLKPVAPGPPLPPPEAPTLGAAAVPCVPPGAPAVPPSAPRSVGTQTEPSPCPVCSYDPSQLGGASRQAQKWRREELLQFRASIAGAPRGVAPLRTLRVGC